MKTEPQDHPQQPSYPLHEQGYQEQEVDEGAVALDDGYAVAESYEYQYEDTGHTRQTERGQGTNGKITTQLVVLFIAAQLSLSSNASQVELR